ncbi:MAG: hypothetical protein RLO19_02950 [Coleofasciculus sp. G2-EDA-02]
MLNIDLKRLYCDTAAAKDKIRAIPHNLFAVDGSHSRLKLSPHLLDDVAFKLAIILLN